MSKRWQGLLLAATALYAADARAAAQIDPRRDTAVARRAMRSAEIDGAPLTRQAPVPPPPAPYGSAPAPDESGYGGSVFPDRAPRQMREYSFVYIEEPEPPVVRLHDIVTILVDEKAEATANSKFNRTRTETFKAELKEFMRIGKTGNLATAAPNQPTIDANLNGRFNAQGQATDQEGIRYKIAATVVEVLPNGNVVLEARKEIINNKDVWEYRLTGELRSVDISPNNTATSENIANLQIKKTSRGKVYNSTKRPWGVVLYDALSPF